MNQITAPLNLADFTPAKKQFIIARNNVKNKTIWFGNRLMITPDLDALSRLVHSGTYFYTILFFNSNTDLQELFA